MGRFENSLKNELGKNTGKFISNLVFGDMHSTPYRRVKNSSRRATKEAKIAEIEARRQLTEAKATAITIEATERANRERKNQLYTIDAAVLRNIDLLNNQTIPSDKLQLLQMLSALSVQLGTNKWETKGDEAAIRNKYTDALLEKYIFCVKELEIIDYKDPHLQLYQKIVSKTKRTRYWKKNRKWLIPLIIILVISTLFAFVLYPLIFWLCIITISGYYIYKYFKKHNSEKRRTSILEGETAEIKPRQQDVDHNIELRPESIENESIFFDLNKDKRIETRLSFIWEKYQKIINNNMIQRKPIFSADGVEDSILFVGVNPSYNPEDDKTLISSEDKQSLMYGSFYLRNDAPDYFKSLEKFASILGKGYTHINLLYARENNRDNLLLSNNDFIREQLELTYDTIIKIHPVTIIFFSDYCHDMIFGTERWVNPATEKDGHFILKGTNIPIYFSDDITVIDEMSRMTLIHKIETIL